MTSDLGRQASAVFIWEIVVHGDHVLGEHLNYIVFVCLILMYMGFAVRVGKHVCSLPVASMRC